MLKPTNSAAEQIVILRSENNDILAQQEALANKKKQNDDSILIFEQVATWVEVDDEDNIVPNQDLSSEDFSPESPDSPENAKVIENPIR